MRTIHVNRFDGGIADDIYNASVGEFSISKQFDILTYGNRLFPLRGMTAESVTTTSIGNIIVDSTSGLLFGVGESPSNPGSSSRLWERSGYGATDVWQAFPTNDQLGSYVYNPAFLVDFRNAGNVKTIFWACANQLLASDPASASSASQQSLTFTSIGQGFVHPTDQILYFPYNTSSNCIIGLISSNATPFTGLTSVALTLPKQYRSYCLCSYGNYLAIPVTTPLGSSVGSSRVFLWNRDTTLATVSESIPWGGDLRVLNNLNGILIGVSTSSPSVTDTVQDYASVLIKGYAGGEPFIIKEIAANHLVGGGGAVSVSINPNVNFVYKNRLYFSVNVVSNTGSALYGLWSVGKNKNGRWTVTIERVATNANTETGVRAAAITGDFVSMAHTADGTLTYTTTGGTSSTTYGATSVYESAVNPDMPLEEKSANKKLVAVACHFAPLTTGAQVVMKARVDSTGSWTTLFTKTTSSPDSNLTVYETPIIAGMAIADGRNFEFRIESTGGAQITGFTYRYKVLTTNI